MELSTLFLGSGFALFITLLAWGNRIRESRSDIRKLEGRFIRNFDTDKRTITPLVKESFKSVKKSPTEGFADMMSSLVEIMDNISEPKDVEVIDKFKDVFNFRNKLERFYKTRYISALIFTFLLFVLGILSEYNGSLIVENPLPTYPLNFYYLACFLTTVFFILIVMIIVYFKEEKYIVLIEETDDIMGVD